MRGKMSKGSKTCDRSMELFLLKGVIRLARRAVCGVGNSICGMKDCETWDSSNMS